MTKDYKTGGERRIHNAKEQDDWNRSLWGGSDQIQLTVDDLLLMAAGGKHTIGYSDDGEYSHSIALSEEAQAFMKGLFKP